MLVFCHYTVYTALCHKWYKGTALCTCRCILRPENICFWGARSRILYRLLFLSVHLGVLPPPPQYQKAGYASVLNRRYHLPFPPTYLILKLAEGPFDSVLWECYEVIFGVFLRGVVECLAEGLGDQGGFFVDVVMSVRVAECVFSS